MAGCIGKNMQGVRAEYSIYASQPYQLIYVGKTVLVDYLTSPGDDGG